MYAYRFFVHARCWRSFARYGYWLRKSPPVKASVYAMDVATGICLGSLWIRSFNGAMDRIVSASTNIWAGSRATSEVLEILRESLTSLYRYKQLSSQGIEFDSDGTAQRRSNRGYISVTEYIRASPQCLRNSTSKTSWGKALPTCSAIKVIYRMSQKLAMVLFAQ